MRLALPLAVLPIVVHSAYAPTDSSLSAPPEAAADSSQWENLQVLPDSLTRDELTGIMRGFTGALGVRCTHCHVREDGEFDFPSDAKTNKEVARGMIRMVRPINAEILPAIQRETGYTPAASGAMEVTCWTCHQGSTTPAATMPPPVEE